MTDDRILRKAIRKAIINGWNPPYLDGKNNPFSVIFRHDFAKAFWGEETKEVIHGIVTQIYFKPKWQYHLQQMVLEENPIKYLEKFLN